MDTAIAVALASLGSAAVAAIGGVVVAAITNRRESENAAEDAHVATLRERLTLRDEQNADLRQRLQDAEERARAAEARAAVAEAKVRSDKDREQ